MAFNNPQIEFHVNGLCKVYVFNPKQYLGYTSEAGVHVMTEFKTLPVFTDAFGDQVPEDVQNMGMLATIDFELIKWDQTVLSVLQSRMPGIPGTSPAGTQGNAPNVDNSGNILIGSLLKQCNWMFPVIVERGGNVGCETNVEGPYDFGACYLVPDDFNLGTKNTRHKLTFNAIPNASGVIFQISSGA